MSESILKIEHLYHRYSQQWAVEDINLEIGKRGVWGLLGSNGAGKSTTMNIICGVLSPTRGKVFINGVDLAENPIEAKKYIGFLPQTPPLYTDQNVDEYLGFCARLRGIAKKDVHDAVERVKEKCGIAHFSKRVLRHLSGGYQQRLGIAQAIIHQPALVVLDEPTNGLDPNQIIEIRHLIKEIARERSVLLSTHILPEVQAACNESRMIEHGEVVFSGTIEEFNNYARPDSFVVTMGNLPNREVLEKIPGIEQVEMLTENCCRVFFSGSQDILEQVVRESVLQEWHLREITLERESLDSVFAQLSNKKLN